jgi:hypothetical protein
MAKGKKQPKQTKKKATPTLSCRQSISATQSISQRIPRSGGMPPYHFVAPVLPTLAGGKVITSPSSSG